MEINDKVKVIASPTMKEAMLDDLIGRTGIVVEVMTNKLGIEHGAWIELDGEPFLEEQEWFIPCNSLIVYE